MKPLGKSESPVVEKTFRRRQCVTGARQSLIWGGLNLLLAAFMYIELGYVKTINTFILIQPILWYIECGLAVLFTANVLWHILTYLAWSLTATVVEVNPLQRKLLDVKDDEPGFHEPSSSSPQSVTQIPTPAFSPSSFTTTRATYCGISTPITPAHLGTVIPNPYGSFTGLSPLGSTPSPQRSPSSRYGSSLGQGSPNSGSFMASGSFLGASNLVEGSHCGSGMSPSLSKHYSLTGAGSPLSMSSTISPLLQDSDAYGLRARLTGSSLKSSPLRSDECITDQKTLEQFLIKQLDKEQKRQAVSRTVSPAGSSSFWNQSPSLMDHSSVISKYQYQIACRSPQQTKVKGDDIDEPVNFLAEEVWASQNVHVDDVDRWIENLRKWLSKTILSHLLNEIDKINDTLARIGCEDMQIGEVGIATLKQLATTKVLHVPTLNSVIPFLEVCANQEYLVSRIRELGAGGAMSSYKWNGGGVFKGKPWGQHLPTDAAILMHLLCSYMDARLLPHPKYPDGKTFTAQYFVKTPDKPDLTKKDNLLLYQAKVNPPHFKVIIEDHVLSPPKGRNNMFHAVLLFLHHIHVKHHGMLGRINLGLSGINILWILDVNPQRMSPARFVTSQSEDKQHGKQSATQHAKKHH